MCGRYYVDDETARQIERIVWNLERKLQPGLRCGDVCPSQAAAVIWAEGERLSAGQMHWGFPQYQRSGLLINARAETATLKKTFQKSMKSQRCVIPARSFYEWNPKKEKAEFSRPDKGTLYMAGCYGLFPEQARFVIITTQANETAGQVHSRMPLLLEEKELKPWLLDGTAAELLLQKIPGDIPYRMEYEQQSLFPG